MNACRYRYPLSFQTVLPDDYGRNSEFSSLLELLSELGFWGVELNMSNPLSFNFEAVCGFLDRFNLKFSMLATGLTARRLGLSLSDPDESVRRRSVAACREMIEWIKGPDTGLIIGLMKGAPKINSVTARTHFSRSLADIMPLADAMQVPVLVEATNSTESSIANTVDDAVALIEGCGSRCARVLPDTYHMNLEEPEMLPVLRRNVGHFCSIHLSDDNRGYPGEGKIDFPSLLKGLEAIGYSGRMAIEGNSQWNLFTGLRATAKYLKPLLTDREDHQA